MIRGLLNLPCASQACAVTIGNFDGVHRGHQALLRQTTERARALGIRTTVLSFEPTPREYFSRERAPARVSNLRTKVRDLCEAGVDRLVLQRFDAAFAQLEARVFVQQVLVKTLQARAVVIGDDFRFGARRAGDLELLHRMGQDHGFEVDGIGSVREGALRCSSTALREVLGAPDLSQAECILGRPFRIVGRVRSGLQLGRRLGMPTANIMLRRPPALRLGVYAVRARVLGMADGESAWTPAVANLGVRPTLGLTRCLLETHLIDRTLDLYGCTLEVEFCRYLRPELKFDGLEPLAAQMQQDKLDATAYFASAGAATA